MEKMKFLPFFFKAIKKILPLFIILAFLILPLISLAADANPLTNLNQATPEVLKNKSDLPTVVGGIIKAILGMLGVIFLAFIVYAGFLWAIAEGDPGKIQKAKTIIVWSIAGLIVCLGSYAITLFVLGGLGIK